MLNDIARNYWNAAFFYRRADPTRDRSIAVKVLEQVDNRNQGAASRRAATMLKEIANGAATPRQD